MESSHTLTSYCPSCHAELAPGECCPFCDLPIDAVAGSSGPMVFPPAPLGRRIGGAALEVATLVGLDLVGLLLMPFTAGLAGSLASLFGAAYIVARDLGGGAMSFGRAVARTRVIDAESGGYASTTQALLRNGPYVLCFLMGALPDPLGLICWPVLFVLLTLDFVMVAASPSRRRLGDLLAGTMVVPVGRNR